jgi:hypothetical protein
VAVPFLKTAFVSGEITPAAYGRVDIDREQVGATTMRNCFVDYRGGARSRAGTKFVGFSKQTDRDFPPRLIPFQFSINQGLVLEFGHEYMRVIINGAYVTESPVAIGNATQADPCVLTFGAEGASAATPNDGGVIFSYAPGDLVTLAGGSALSPAVLEITNSKLLSLLPDNPGSGYSTGDTITLAGGTATTQAIAAVATVVSVAATGSFTFTDNPSDGETLVINGVTWTFKTTASGSAETQIQSTLAGTISQLAADLSASSNASLTVASYSAQPAQLLIAYDTTGTGGNAYTIVVGSGTPATASGATLAGGTTSGIGSVNITTAGIYTALPSGAAMTQSSTSGGGSGATFQTALFGPNTVSISNPGAYSSVPANPVAQDSSTGIGQGATFTLSWASVSPYSNDDWLFVSSVEGMTELNGNTYRAAGVTSTSVELLDIYGDQVDSTGYNAYTGGGTVAKIYTLTTPYSEVDLPYLKFTQSADVMTICCVNQETGAEYEPQNLSRAADDDWSLSAVVETPSVNPPSSVTASISGSGTAYYKYAVTSVSPDDGSESVSSPTTAVHGVAISTEAGQVTVNWSPVSGVEQYNIYKAQPSFGTLVPAGALLGYAGTAYGTQFDDTNIVPDFSQVPPRHLNPFARGQIVAVNLVTGGSGYTSAHASISTSTGSGASIELVIQNGSVVAAIIDDAGQNYKAGDQITIIGNGSGATASLSIGAQSGTYPSAVSYFQERRAFANSLNNTDTYWMSQPGAFNNFDARIPPVDTDAIVGSPWSVEVNGIQWMIQTSGGLLVMTGLSAWLLVGAGSFATNVQAISPSTQDAVTQAFSGVSPTVVPVKIHYDVIYVNSKGSYYYALPYQLYVLSEPIDLTELSSHLFDGFTIIENTWCEQPSKLLWAIRDDGVMLSMTYYKAQQVVGWSRHDTNGEFVSCASVTELPIDALYVATKRYPGTKTAYMVERMDDRLWTQVEDAWCVDAGLSLPQPTPNATLTVDSATGAGRLTGVTSLVGGSGYSAATTCIITDDNGEGPGSGAVAVPVISGGVITGVTFTNEGSGYTRPAIAFSDPAGSVGGSGASATVVLDNSATFTASTSVFSAGSVGSVIRSGGGIATITGFTDSEHVTANITTPITDLIPNSGGAVTPQPSGTWTMTAPISQVFGLDHLIGATVTGLADGNVIAPRVVAADGSITLDTPASSVVVGLGFQAQLQPVYFEAPGVATTQGQRKKTAAVNALLQASRGVKVGGAQPDGATQSPLQIAPEWQNLTEVDTSPSVPLPPYNSNVVPLYTGYFRVPVEVGFNLTGQSSLQQDLPLPMNVVAIVQEVLGGDTPDNSVQPKQAQGR